MACLAGSVWRREQKIDGLTFAEDEITMARELACGSSGICRSRMPSETAPRIPIVKGPNSSSLGAGAFRRCCARASV